MFAAGELTNTLIKAGVCHLTRALLLLPRLDVCNSSPTASELLHLTVSLLSDSDNHNKNHSTVGK